MRAQNRLVDGTSAFPSWHLWTVYQLRYGRIPTAVRAYSNCDTPVRQLRYGHKMRSMGLPNGVTILGCGDDTQVVAATLVGHLHQAARVGIGMVQRQRHMPHRAPQIHFHTGMQLHPVVFHHHHVDAQGACIATHQLVGEQLGKVGDGLLHPSKAMYWPMISAFSRSEAMMLPAYAPLTALKTDRPQ